MKKLSLITLLIAVLVGFAFADIPPVIPNTYVQDHANVLTPEDEANIQNQLNQLKIKYNLEFAVATVNTTSPTDIASYSIAMARTYGIGAKDGEKRGILLLLAIQDHKWRFEISRHMEAVLTDGQSGSIGRGVLVPAMKKAKDSAGYTNAILLTVSAVEQQIVKNIEPEQKDPPYVQNPQGSSGIGLLGVLGGIVLLGVLGGGGYGLFSWRRRRREEEEERQALEERRLAEEERKRVRDERLAREEAERLAHEAWLKTPEGIAETARLEQERVEQERIEKQRQRQQERLAELERQRYEKWAKSPEGKAELARREEEAKKKASEAAKRKKEEYEREQKEEEYRRARRRREESYSSSSYGSSYSSGSSSSYSSGSSSSSDSGSSGSFGGGSDFGGGGSDGSW